MTRTFTNSKLLQNHPLSTTQSSMNSQLKNMPKLKYYVYKVYKYLSLQKDLKWLMTKTNKYYDDSGMELISFFRFFLILWSTYNLNIYSLLKFPHRDFFNYGFYNSIYFSLVKYSSFANDCWICLDGVIVGYKLMSFLKKRSSLTINNNFSVWIFLDLIRIC